MRQKKSVRRKIWVVRRKVWLRPKKSAKIILNLYNEGGAADMKLIQNFILSLIRMSSLRVAKTSVNSACNLFLNHSELPEECECLRER